MTVASLPTESTAETRRISRRELFLWTAAVLAINMFVHRLDASSASAFLGSLADFNIIICLAWFVVVKRLLASKAAVHADAGDTAFASAICVASCLTSVIPTSMAISALATIAALYVGFRHGQDANLKAAAVVIGALAVNALWGPVFFNLFALELLRADAALLGTAYAITRPDITWLDTTLGIPGGHSIVIGSGCSSFHNISLALLAWVSLTMLRRPCWVHGDVFVASTVVVAMVLINAIRLYLMGWSREGYEYWHNGTGVQIYAVAATLAIIVIGFGGASRAEHDP